MKKIVLMALCAAAFAAVSCNNSQPTEAEAEKAALETAGAAMELGAAALNAAAQN